MLVSAVPDPSAFDASYFDKVYIIQAEDFLRGIEKNGLLIVDSGKRIQNALIERITSLPIKYRQQLQIRVEDLLLKKKSKRTISCPLSQNGTTLNNLLDTVCQLKTYTKADAIIIGNKSLQTLKTEQRYTEDIVPLSEYRESEFETNRQRYENPVGPIDSLSKSDVENLIIQSIRYTRRLCFYDAYIGSGNNTSRFRKGIEYILNIWKDHGFFIAQQADGPVRIFTCNAEQIRDDETDHAKESKSKRNQEYYRKIIRELIEPLKNQFGWPIELYVKSDPDGIFHARYLETQHAVIRVDRGFDLFKQNGGFRRNFFTLNLAEGSHLKECRELPNADVNGMV